MLDSEKAAAVVDAGAWFAGARQHYCGVIELTATSPRQGPVLQTRYSRSRDSARLRVTISARHTPEQITGLCSALRTVVAPAAEPVGT